MAKVLTVGNIVVDLIVKPEKDLPKWGRLCQVDLPITPHIGGNGAIFAAFMAGLIKDCAIVGFIGEDMFGDWLLAELEKVKVDTSAIKRTKGNTSATAVLVDRDARRAFLHHIGPNEKVDLDSIPGDFMGARWLHLASVFILPGLPPKSCTTLLRKAKEAGLYTSVDLVWDPSEKWDMDKMAGFADVLFLNQEEGEAVTGTNAPLEILDMMATMGPKITVLKMGDAGCAVKLQSGETFFAPSFEVKAVDSTGAGDAFNAGFVYGLLNVVDNAKGGRKKKGKSKDQAKDILDLADMQTLKKVALMGNALGAISVTQMGGVTEPPSQRALLDFVRTQKKRMAVD